MNSQLLLKTKRAGGVHPTQLFLPEVEVCRGRWLIDVVVGEVGLKLSDRAAFHAPQSLARAIFRNQCTGIPISWICQQAPGNSGSLFVVYHPPTVARTRTSSRSVFAFSETECSRERGGHLLVDGEFLGQLQFLATELFDVHVFEGENFD